MYKEYYITLPGGFALPVGLCLETYTFRETLVTEQDPDTVHRQLQAFSRRYLQQQMITGTVRSSRETLVQKQGVFMLQGQYVCEEMIGRERKIGETNE